MADIVENPADRNVIRVMADAIATQVVNRGLDSFGPPSDWGPPEWHLIAEAVLDHMRERGTVVDGTHTVK